MGSGVCWKRFIGSVANMACVKIEEVGGVVKGVWSVVVVGVNIDPVAMDSGSVTFHFDANRYRVSMQRAAEG